MIAQFIFTATICPKAIISFFIFDFTPNCTYLISLPGVTIDTIISIAFFSVKRLFKMYFKISHTSQFLSVPLSPLPSFQCSDMF